MKRWLVYLAWKMIFFLSKQGMYHPGKVSTPDDGPPLTFGKAEHHEGIETTFYRAIHSINSKLCQVRNRT